MWGILFLLPRRHKSKGLRGPVRERLEDVEPKGGGSAAQNHNARGRDDGCPQNPAAFLLGEGEVIWSRWDESRSGRTSVS